MRKKRKYRKKNGVSRREFLKIAGIAGASLYLPVKFNLGKALAAPIPGGSLNPLDITKYAMPLVVPPAMPKTAGGMVDYYEIAVRQFQQQILPSNKPMTTVWSYGSVNHPATFNYPAFTIEATNNRPVRVRWINGLVDANGKYLPHILPVDQTLHWANPLDGTTGRDTRPTFASTPGSYTGPVPMVPHLHGGHNAQESDGYAEAWYLPMANNIPSAYAKRGSYYNFFKTEFQSKFGTNWLPGSATFQYENDQRASTLWYHDHTLGMTRLNVYAGPAGFYLLRGGPDDEVDGTLPGPAPGVGDDPFGRWFEIPIAIQDRSFNADGSLFYPDSRAFFDGATATDPGYIPATDISPIWNPEFFGNTMVVNGQTWPYLEVERRRYRFRFLNGCNSRFLILKMDKNLLFWQIGSEGGFLPEPVRLGELLMSPAERADVIVDFTGVKEGTEIILLNLGPDEPFGGGTPGKDFEPADPNTTGQVMKFVVVERVGRDMSVDPKTLGLPSFKPIGAVSNTRQVSLNEMMSTYFDGPAAAMLGTLDGAGNPVPKMWADPITENPALGATEVWEMYNFTEDAHPIHIHEIMFQVVNRETFDGDVRDPEEWESGLKDTVIAYPGEITRIRGTFDLPGLYVWHCHIVEHEDNEMMRPYFIGPMP